MNQDKIAALKAAAERATPGPWWAGKCDPADGHALAWIGKWFVDPEYQAGTHKYNEQQADAEYIAQANPQAILYLIERLEAAEKDAARYLWLRAQHWNDSAFAVVSEPKRNVKLGTYCPSEDRLDQEIDSAMGADHE